MVMINRRSTANGNGEMLLLICDAVIQPEWELANQTHRVGCFIWSGQPLK
jgi:hypothetical protein